jgi:hypothetical protein
MTVAVSITKPRTSLRKILKVLWIASVCLVSLCFVAVLVWRYSGSNQWELLGDKNGVRVYTLKEPGMDLLQVKGVMRVRSTLAGLVAMNLDLSFCDEMGCKDTGVLERDDDQLQYVHFRFDLPFPFKPREFVVRTHTYQNPKTHDVLMEVSAAPDKMPPNSCCLRVTEMNNTIRFIPLGNGQVEIEYIQHLNEGGYLPFFMLNRARSELMFANLPKLQGFLDREKYKSAKYDFIKEYQGNEGLGNSGVAVVR